MKISLDINTVATGAFSFVSSFIPLVILLELYGKK
jgi:hypothetical protein